MIIRKNIKLCSEEKLKIKDVRNILADFSDEDTLSIFKSEHSKKPGDPEVTVYYFTVDKLGIV